MAREGNIYFASDFHLGVPDAAASLEREKRICRWMDSIKSDAAELYLLGDVFDFWFEYRTAIPRGFARIQGKIAELSDRGIPIHWFTGNHDMWIFNYIPKELGVTLHRSPVVKDYGGKKFYIGHGDGLGPGDHRYKFIKKVFASRLCQWLFARLHPNFGIGIAKHFSQKSRAATVGHEEVFLGEDKEFLVQHCKEVLASEHFDYFIFGHRHLPLDLPIGKSRYVNLGDWVNHNSYAVFDGHQLHLRYFRE